MDMATSYINEHTAEYYLVPELKRVLENEFRYVAPVFPWLSRELSKVSRELHGADRFGIFIMFPRRPKLGSGDSRTIYTTINPGLERFCEVCSEYEVPVIGGCPSAATLWDLADGSNAVWLDIRHPTLSTYLNPIENSNARLTEKEIRVLARQAPLVDLDTFERFVRDARESESERMFGPRYKPVYFLMKEAR